MKLTGRGLSQGLHETEFSSLGGRPQRTNESGVYFYSIPIERAGQEFWLTLCSGGTVKFRTEWTDYNIL